MNKKQRKYNINTIMINLLVIVSVLFLTTILYAIYSYPVKQTVNYNKLTVYPIRREYRSHKETEVVNTSSHQSLLDSLITRYNDIDKSELKALSVTLYCEARGEPEKGIKLVADTIRNRVKSSFFPNTYREVVTQPYQFSCIKDKENLDNNIVIRGNSDEVMLKVIVDIAYSTITNKLPRMTKNSLFYHAKYVTPFWARSYIMVAHVGNHIFYTTNKL